MVGTRKKIRVTEVDEFTELERGLRFDLMIELCSIHRGSFRSYLDLGYIYIYVPRNLFRKISPDLLVPSPSSGESKESRAGRKFRVRILLRGLPQ